RLAQRDKALFGLVGDMGVVGFLLRDGALPPWRTSVRLVIVPGKYLGLIRQGKNGLDGLPERLGAAAGEVSARSAGIRHEQCVVDECCITDHISDGCKSMARREHDPDVDRAD